MHLAVTLIVPVVLLAATCPAAVGEVFVLSSGGRVVGELVNPEESPRRKFVIKTSGGGRITLDRSQVKRVIHAPPAELEYEKIRPRYGDTAEAQWELAQWCGEHQLPDRRSTHLERVIELDGDHARARHALGYHRDNGRWVMREDLMRQRGYVRFEGRWRLPQEIELIESRQKVEKAQAQWLRKLKLWRNWLQSDRNGDARRNILAIDDPYAVKALAAALEDDRRQRARILYIEALANIGTPEAIKVLTTRSLEDPVEEVRLSCLDYLKTKNNADAVAYYIGQLRSKHNYMVHRAAVGLRHLKDPSAIGPLIDALVTTHKYKVSQGSPGSISPGFGIGPGGAPGPSGLSVGGRPKIIKREIANQPVLDALVALTGRNFQYRKQSWKDWHASQTRVNSINLRRD